MGRKQSYIIINCPECGKRVREWADGRISFHIAIGSGGGGCDGQIKTTPSTRKPIREHPDNTTT